LDLLRKYGDVIGIDWDEAPGPLDKLPVEILNLASSPILAAAQITIQGMKATTGSGEPEAGAAFEKSAEQYEEAGNQLIAADVKTKTWDGTAAASYEATNDKHRHLTFEVAEAEKEMQGLLRDLAAQITETRTNLQDAVDFLANYDTATLWMNAIPGGGAVKAAADLGVASTQLGLANASMAKLVAESVLTAHRVRTPLERYENAGRQEMLDPEGDFPCGEPFGDERTEGQLPSRTDPNEPYIPPEPDGPPVTYPPVTPYETPAPR
jgi:hypothetical protein